MEETADESETTPTKSQGGQLIMGIETAEGVESRAGRVLASGQEE
jgi:hypothetical protein